MTSSISHSSHPWLSWKFKLPQQQGQQMIVHRGNDAPIILYKCRKKVIKLRCKPNPSNLVWPKPKTQTQSQTHKTESQAKLKMPRPRNKRLATPHPFGRAEHCTRCVRKFRIIASGERINCQRQAARGHVRIPGGSHRKTDGGHACRERA